MVRTTGKPPSPLPKTFNHATGEFSTRSTGFNETAWGDQTRGFVKLINKQLRPESYDKIVMGAWDIAKKSRGVVCTEEVIDLTGDEPPDEFAMLINIPSDDDKLEDRKIPIIKNHCMEHKMGSNIISNTEQAANTGWDKSYGDWDRYSDKPIDSVRVKATLILHFLCFSSMQTHCCILYQHDPSHSPHKPLQPLANTSLTSHTVSI